MAADFAQERKWRLKSARVLALSVASFHSKRESRAARQQKVRDYLPQCCYAVCAGN